MYSSSTVPSFACTKLVFFLNIHSSLIAIQYAVSVLHMSSSSLTGAHDLRVIVVFACICLLPLDVHNYKVVLHFEHIYRKLLLRMPRNASQLF